MGRVAGWIRRTDNDRDRGGHEAKPKTPDVETVVSELPDGPAPGASKKRGC